MNDPMSYPHRDAERSAEEQWRDALASDRRAQMNEAIWKAVTADDRMRFQLSVMGRVQHSERDYPSDTVLPHYHQLLPRWQSIVRGWMRLASRLFNYEGVRL